MPEAPAAPRTPATSATHSTFDALAPAGAAGRESLLAGVSRARLMGVTLAWALAIAAGATLLEWGGWQIVWRSGEPRLLDAHWRGMFLAGVARNASAAVGVGAIAALVALAIARSRPAWRARAKRLALVAFGAGSVLFLAVASALVRLAP